MAASASRIFGVIFLGASHFPYMADRGLDNPVFAASKERMHEVLAQEYLLATRVEYLDLFDKDLRIDQIIEEVNSFLRDLPELTDLIIYYCGHGTFLEDNEKTYCLLLHSSKHEREASTTLQFRTFRLDLENLLRGKHIFLFLDCCYAAAAVASWQNVNAINLIANQIEAAFPTKGTALFAAASKIALAIAPTGDETTLFTGHVVAAIRKCVRGKGIGEMSLAALAQYVRDQIRTEPFGRQVLPELHNPRQDQGDVSLVPLFRNTTLDILDVDRMRRLCDWYAQKLLLDDPFVEMAGILSGQAEGDPELAAMVRRLLDHPRITASALLGAWEAKLRQRQSGSS
jgi:hypothetical protein